MRYLIATELVKKSRIDQLDFNNIPLGKTFTDHMFVCDYKDGAWHDPRVEPLHLVPTHPAAMALHYGQAIFEGMKAYKNLEGQPILFRPEMNAKRLNKSADRMGMPGFPEELFVEGLKHLVATDQAWIPTDEGSALYLRPFMYADEAFIGMRAATSFKFIIIASPSSPIFSKRIKLKAEPQYIRAAHGGTGEAKAAGNYAAAIKPTEIAKNEGYDQVLWLDAHDHKYIQEVGTMNIFFQIGDDFITPKLDGSILAGITRDSVIQLLRSEGYRVKEKLISIDEIKEAHVTGQLKEAFGTGTAVGITFIEGISIGNDYLKLSEDNPVAKSIKEKLHQIKTGKIEDKFNWVVEVNEALV